MSFQLLFTCAIADERLEVADERLEGCQHYAFKEYKNANGVRILGGHADGAIQWECELFVGRPKARCYPFDLPKHRFRGRNPKVYIPEICSISEVNMYDIMLSAGLCLFDRPLPIQPQSARELRDCQRL